MVRKEEEIEEKKLEAEAELVQHDEELEHLKRNEEVINEEIKEEDNAIEQL